VLSRDNNPSGVPGVNFMGGIHPRLKRPAGKRCEKRIFCTILCLNMIFYQNRLGTSIGKALKKKCVCRRLAYAAAKLLKQQEQDDQKLTQGALTGPTLAGCRYGPSSSSSSSSSSSKTAEGGGEEAGGGSASASKLTLMFNESLLGGEGLMLRPFDANETGGWLDSRGNGLKDSNGAMVCTVDPTCKEAPNHECGNTTTCQCQSWNFIKSGCCGADPKHPGCPANGFCNMTNFWYCEVGPGTVNAFLSHFQCSVYQDRLGTDIGKVEG
jgi:hypothetical protein